MSLQGTIERPERGAFYFGIYREMKSLTVAGDPQRERVYAWEQEVHGELEREELLGTLPGCRGVSKQEARTGAVAYIEHLWNSYSPHFEPYFTGMPYLRIGFPRSLFSIAAAPRKRHAAHASVQKHSIYCKLDALTRSTIVHEVCHLLAWRDRHGPEFCRALVHLWEQEFKIHPTRSRMFAAKHGVQIA